MPRPIVPTYPVGKHLTLAAMGDSLTHNFGYGVLAHLFWPELLAGSLRGANVPIKARNFGRTGNTTVQMLDRFPNMTAYDVPVIGVIWGGANDPTNSITGAATQANLQTMAETLFAAGTTYVVIGNTQYLNYTSGGDTVGAQSSTYATLKTFQKAAADALKAAHPGKVAYCDTYAFMRQKIMDGIETQGSASWHVAGTNQHLNALGHRYVADAMLATILAQSGWLTALGGSV